MRRESAYAWERQGDKEYYLGPYSMARKKMRVSGAKDFIFLRALRVLVVQSLIS
jgi:hypothetical protein